LKRPVTASNIHNRILNTQMHIHYATRPEALKRYCLNWHEKHPLNLWL